MKKKIVSAMLVAAMAAGMLAGCGGSSTGSTGSTGSSTPSTEGGAEVNEDGSVTTSVGTYSPENPYHCTFAYIEFYQQDEAARAAVQDALNEYMIPNYCIEVEFLPLQAAEYVNKLQLMMSGGDALDVLPVPAGQAASWIAMDGIYDMAQLMSSADAKGIIEALGEQNAWVGQMNGVLYGFPANKESVELGGLEMRADICDELGLTEKYDLDREGSDTYTGTSIRWEEAEEIFALVKEKYPDMYPLYLNTSSQYNRFVHFDILSDKFGTLDLSVSHEDCTVVNMFETEQYINYVKMMADWYDKGYIYPEAATDTQGAATMIKAGNTFSVASAIKPGFLSEQNAAMGQKMYALYVNPFDEGYLGTDNVAFINTGIANNSEDPEMAFKFISAFYSDPTVYNMWLYGIEGENYQILEDGTAYFVEGEDGANYKYHQNIGWELGNQFQSYVWNDGTKDADYWNLLKSHNDWGYFTQAFGFKWDSTEYATQVTALTNALETYRATLETGAEGSAKVEETLKALNDALYAAGLQEVMDAKQAQLDEFKSRQ